MYCGVPTFHRKYVNMTCRWTEFQCEGGGGGGVMRSVIPRGGGGRNFQVWCMVLVKQYKIVGAGVFFILSSVGTDFYPRYFWIFFADVSSCRSFRVYALFQLERSVGSFIVSLGDSIVTAPMGESGYQFLVLCWALPPSTWIEHESA